MQSINKSSVHAVVRYLYISNIDNNMFEAIVICVSRTSDDSGGSLLAIMVIERLYQWVNNVIYKCDEEK